MEFYEEIEQNITSSLKEGNVAAIAEYEDMPNVSGEEYDIVIYRMVSEPRFYFGHAIAKIYDSLKTGGELYLDWTGYAGDIDQVQAVVSLMGFAPAKKDDKNFMYSFVKESK